MLCHQIRLHFSPPCHFPYYVRVVQLVEHSTDNRVVGGSNPPVNTKTQEKGEAGSIPALSQKAQARDG